MINNYKEINNFVNDSLPQLSEDINNKWNEMEKIWYKWDSNDLLNWCRYRLKWNKIPNDVNWIDMTDKCSILLYERQCINKITLNDFKHIGFNVRNERDTIYKNIQNICNKYQNENINKVNSITKGETVPAEFFCPISKNYENPNCCMGWMLL